LSQYRDSATYYRDYQRPHALANIYKHLANYFFLNKQADSTTYYSRLAMETYGLVGDSFSYHYCMMILGQVTMNRHFEPMVSLGWLEAAGRYFERIHDYNLAQHAFFSIGNYYFDHDLPDQREHYWSRAMALNAMTNDTLLRVIYRAQRCQQWAEEEKWPDIIPFARECAELSRLMHVGHFEKVAWFRLGQAYYYTGRLADSEDAISRFLSIPQKNELEEQAYFLLGSIYLRTGRPEQSEAAFATHRKLMEAQYSQREKDRVEELLLQYEAQRKEAHIESLRKENALQERHTSKLRAYVMALALAVLGLGGAAWIIRRNGRRQRILQAAAHAQQQAYQTILEQEKEGKLRAEFDKQIAEVQLKALSAQMNPHFIFNCMNSIQKYVLKNEKDRALDFLQHFAELIRVVLDNSTQARVPLEDEIRLLEKYILLEQLRMEGRFDYTIHVDPDVQADFLEVPTLILQPYVENAIWHGLMNKPGHGRLALSFTLAGDRLKCVVEDDGIGRALAGALAGRQADSRNRYGMSISRKRLDLLQRQDARQPDILVEDLVDASGHAAGTRIIVYFQIDGSHGEANSSLYHR